MVVTIQLELAERMAARPGTRDYSALSVWLQSQCRVEILRRLPPSVFWPRPKVDSAIVRIDPDSEARGRIADRAFFHDFLRQVFTLRRKHLRGVLAGLYRDTLDKPAIDAILAELALPETTRAEQLPVETLVQLSNRLFFRGEGMRG
jgi:16S rRNA (adenine1518-N6/adenine1519-N6)-dimethyltransferase